MLLGEGRVKSRLGTGDMGTGGVGTSPEASARRWEATRAAVAENPALPLGVRLRLLTRLDAVYASYSAQLRAHERLASLPPLTSYPTTG